MSVSPIPGRWVLDRIADELAESPVLAPERAAERLAAPGGGSGHPRPAERRTGPEAS